MKQNIGFVTYTSSPNFTSSDNILRTSLETSDFQVKAVAWDDLSVNWSSFNTLVLRSCWNYHLKINEFNMWLDRIHVEKITLWNPCNVVRWNIHKSYLLELEQKGIPIIPTSLI